MSHDGWEEEFPPLQRGVQAGAGRAGARLVVLDNLYSYGSPRGEDLVETMPANPTSRKSATRAAMTAELLDAHQRGQVEVAIARASDYFGPGTVRSALGDTVFAAALKGRAAQVMGDPDQPHSYSYTPDVAAGLITLGSAAARPPAGSGTSPWPRRAPRARSSSWSTSSPTAAPAPSPPAAGRSGCSAWSSPSCVSTSTRSTSSPSRGSWTTASSGPPSAILPTPLGTALDHHPRLVPDHRVPAGNRLSPPPTRLEPPHERPAPPPASPEPRWPSPPGSPSPGSPSSARSSSTPRSWRNRRPTSSPSSASTRGP